MPRVTTDFTAAELEAAEWSKDHTRRQGGSSSSFSSNQRKNSKRGYTRRRDRDEEEEIFSKVQNFQPRSSLEEEEDISTVKETESSRKKEKKKKKKHKKHDSQSFKRRKYSISEDSHSDISNNSFDMPRSVKNPLQAAYDVSAYKRRVHRRSPHIFREKPNFSQWNHDRYENRSPSPCRERTEGRMWETRKDSWRSRAGGICLPPEPIEFDENEASKYKLSFQVPSLSSEFHPRDSSLPHLKRRGSPIYELD